MTLQREITRSLTVDVSYIGNKASKLVTGRQINDVDIFNNGFLNAFNITRSGGNAPIFDTLLNGVNIAGVGVVGQGGLTGSSALRRFTTTNAFIANGQVGNLANFLNTSAALGGLPGTILRKNGLPENFFVVNPQFGSMAYQSNNGNSTYNAGKYIFATLTHGLSAQGPTPSRRHWATTPATRITPSQQGPVEHRPHACNSRGGKLRGAAGVKPPKRAQVGRRSHRRSDLIRATWASGVPQLQALTL